MLESKVLKFMVKISFSWGEQCVQVGIPWTLFLVPANPMALVAWSGCDFWHVWAARVWSSWRSTYLPKTMAVCLNTLDFLFLVGWELMVQVKEFKNPAILFMINEKVVWEKQINSTQLSTIVDKQLLLFIREGQEFHNEETFYRVSGKKLWYSMIRNVLWLRWCVQ